MAQQKLYFADLTKAMGMSSFLHMVLLLGGCASRWTASGRRGRAGPQAGLCVP